MLLQVTIQAYPDLDPNSPAAINSADAAASQKATAWTTPVYVGQATVANGALIYYYQTDAIPRVDPSVVTTANAAPTLLPPT